MQENEDERMGKHPIEMTTDELLDYVVHPEVAEKLRERVREDDDCDSESD